MVSGSSMTTVGIDVGHRQIKAAQLRRSQGRWQIQALAVIPRTSAQVSVDSQEAQRVRSVLSRQGFCGNDVVLAVPDDKLLTGVLDLPPRGSGAPIDQIVRMELSRMHKVPPESLEISYWHLPASERAKDSAPVMAVGCTHDDANELLDTFENAGMNVRALDVRICAAARACSAVLAPKPAITAILDIGWSSTSLSMLSLGAVTYERILPNAGLQSLSEQISGKFALDSQATDRVLKEVTVASDGKGEEADKAALEEVGKVVLRHLDHVVEGLRAPFAYITHQYSGAEVKRLLLIGGAAYAGLSQHFSSALQVEAMAVTPADLAVSPTSILTESGNAALTVAIGLAKFGKG